MGQRKREQDDNQNISDISNADQRPENEAAAADDDDDDDVKKKLLLQKIKLSGNFHTYREMKLKQLQSKRSDDTEPAASTTDDGGGQSNSKDESWNHFITPLKPSLLPTTSSNRSRSSNSSETKSTIKEETTTQIKSVFSDLERTQTIDRFGHIFMNQMGNVMTSGKLASAWGDDGSSKSSTNNSLSMFSWLFVDYSPDAATKKRETTSQPTTIVNPKDYAAERRMITPHLTPFVWGTTCVAVTLCSLRLGRWYQGRTLGRAASSSSLYNRSNYTTTSAAAMERNRLHDLRSNKSSQSYGQYNDNMNMGNHPSSYQNQKNALLSNLSTLPVDLAISLLVGISTSIFLTRPEDLLHDVSKAPLLQGKSVLREELCPSFTQEMDRINRGYHTYTPSGKDAVEKQVVPFQDLWKDENIGDFATLKAIRDFVANCHSAENAGMDEEK